MIDLKTTTSMAVALFAIVNTNGEVIFSNAPALGIGVNSQGYSDAFSSSGNNWQRQSGAQRIVLNQDYELDGIRWWGGMDNYFQSGEENLAGFEIVLWNEDFTEQVANQTLTIEEVQSSQTGFLNANGSVYEYFAPFSGAINAGTYHLNIGALYYEINSQSDTPWAGGGVDQWIWTTGMDYVFDPDLPQRMNFSLTSNYPQTGWGNWYASPKNDGMVYYQGGAAQMYAVPNAGSLALLGVAGLFYQVRRRR